MLEQLTVSHLWSDLLETWIHLVMIRLDELGQKKDSLCDNFICV